MDTVGYRFETLSGNNLRLVGELSFASLSGGGPTLSELSGPVVVSLADLDRIDSAGVAQLIEWRAEAQARNADLLYTSLPEQLRQMISAFGIEALFESSADGQTVATDT